MIDLFGGSEYSHTALWAGDCVLDATQASGVAERTLQQAYKHGQKVHVYRDPEVSTRGPNPVVEHGRTLLSADYARSSLYLSGVVHCLIYLLPGQRARESAKVSAAALRDAIDGIRRDPGQAGVPPMTCSAFVATAFYRGGHPLQISITGQRRLAEKKGALEPRWVCDGALRQDDELRALVQQYMELVPELRADLLEAEQTAARLQGTKAMFSAGEDWPLSLVTPRDVSTAIDHLGRLVLPQR